MFENQYDVQYYLAGCVLQGLLADGAWDKVNADRDTGEEAKEALCKTAHQIAEEMRKTINPKP